MKDEEIDLTDIPEIRDWSKALIGKLRATKPQSVKKARGFLKGIDTNIEREPDRS